MCSSLFRSTEHGYLTSANSHANLAPTVQYQLFSINLILPNIKSILEKNRNTMVVVAMYVLCDFCFPSVAHDRMSPLNITVCLINIINDTTCKIRSLICRFHFLWYTLNFIILKVFIGVDIICNSWPDILVVAIKMCRQCLSVALE